jgi:hypothetical protein
MANGDPISTLVERTQRPEELVDLSMEQQVEIALPGTFAPTEAGPVDYVEQEDGEFIREDLEDIFEIDETDFTRNLAEELDKTTSGRLSSQLLGDYQNNKSSRRDWENTYTEGLKLLGLKYEERTQPFRGATGVTHPLLAEAATQFQAQAFNELLPSDGPVRTAVMGDKTEEKEAQAGRVKEFMNYYLTSVMEEYTPEFDQMLFYLPLAGSTFKKVYFDESLDRVVSKFVPASDLVVRYRS